MSKSDPDFDAIIIGSGPGGLSCALSLARAGKKVLVLEQHDVPGGSCHSFQLEGHRFSPGIHYIGDLREGGTFRSYIDGLEISQHLSFVEMNPDGFEHVICGQNKFNIPRGKRNFINRLKERFPDEAQHIENYFQKIDNLLRACTIYEESNSLTPMKRVVKLASIFHPLLTEGSRSLKRQLDKHFQDPFLKAILGSQCGDHGLPPSKAPFVLHALLQNHYFEGAYYPDGGGVTIPRAFLRELKKRDGQLHVKTRVRQILTKKTNGKVEACGVELESGEKISSSIVVSNADAPTTYLSLIGIENLSDSLKKRVAKTRISGACLNLFLAVDTDATKFGLDSGNIWWCESNNLEALFADKGIHGLFISATSLRDPTHRKIGADTLEAIAYCPYELFAPFADAPDGQRGPAYEALKKDLTKTMIAKLDALFPGIAKHITFSALGTPLTHQHYINTTRGSIYGTEKNLWQILRSFPQKTEVTNLFHCGSSTNSFGVSGAIYSGITCAEQILGCGKEEFLSGRSYPLEIKGAEY